MSVIGCILAFPRPAQAQAGPAATLPPREKRTSKCQIASARLFPGAAGAAPFKAIVRPRAFLLSLLSRLCKKLPSCLWRIS